MAKKKPPSAKRRRSKQAGKALSKKKAATRFRIIGVLAAVVFWGLVWGLLSLRERSISADRLHRNQVFQTRMFLREIENALARYKEDRGTIPPSPSEKNGAAVLFEKLLAGQKRYLGPQPDRILHGKTEDEATVIIDSWGDPIRYRTGPPSGAPVSANPDYDLWSTGGDPGNPREKWVTP